MAPGNPSTVWRRPGPLSETTITIPDQFASRLYSDPSCNWAFTETSTLQLRQLHTPKTNGTLKQSATLMLQLPQLRPHKPWTLISRTVEHGPLRPTTWRASSSSIPTTRSSEPAATTPAPNRHGNFSNPSGIQVTTTRTTSELTRVTRSLSTTRMLMPVETQPHSALMVPSPSTLVLSHSTSPPALFLLQQL